MLQKKSHPVQMVPTPIDQFHFYFLTKAAKQIPLYRYPHLNQS